MSLVTTRHIHPGSFRDTLNTSLSKLQSTIPSQLFFRYSFPHSALSRHSLSGRRRSYSTCSGTVDTSNRDREHRNRVIKCSSSRETPSISNLAGRDWLDKWNHPRQQTRPKPVRPVMSYRDAGSSSARSRSIDPGGGGGGSTMEKIVQKLRNFGYMDEESDGEDESQRRIEKGSIEDIFYAEEGTFPNPRGGISKISPLGLDKEYGDVGEARFPWEERSSMEEEAAKNSVRKIRTSVAELTLPESELRRLRHLTIRTKRKVKVGGAGVTKAIVDTIHERWKDSEIVRLKVEGAPALNMRRLHEILERKTGGLVIWRSGTSVSLYRGVSYKDPSVHLKKQILKQNQDSQRPSEGTFGNFVDHSELNSRTSAHPAEQSLVRKTDDAVDTNSLQEVVYENEVDKLLADLGPRYTDWPGGDPLPVDADMLPGVVPGYAPPFRLLPYGVRATLGTKESTALRRIARTLPPHFAIGRSRQLEGLAVAMLKLWEKSSIAKIALKRGVQVTTSERMAESIKKLTGGSLLSRNKDFIVFYRGKDFLSPAVTEALLERERLAKDLQDEEEQARLKASTLVFPHSEGTTEDIVAAGTLGETLDADARWGKKLNECDRENALRGAEVLRHADLVRKLERKLALAEKKLMKAETSLAKVEQLLKPADRQADPDSISDEERYMYRKLGLKMKAFLLLGRRGVFGGTIENMHLHWKYRELVKIIAKAQSFEEVKNIALSLEAESGGVLVSVDKVSKGYAIVVFRGKYYNRPPMLRPKNLLTKRRALARSIELQRREALLKHIASVQKNVGKLRSEIDEMEAMKGHGGMELYDDLDSAYPTEDEEDSEEEGDDGYIDAYDSGDDEDEGGSDSSVQKHSSQQVNLAYNGYSHNDDVESEQEEDFQMNEVGSTGGSDIDSDEDASKIEY